MGDDKANEGIYRFVSARSFQPGRPANNRRILEEGTLYIARFAPGGRRTFATNGDTEPTSATEGTGEWVEVLESELDDTATKLRARFTDTEFNQFFATNRPEDVEVDPDGTVFVALTNNSSVNDAHGSVRRIVEAGNDPTALAFKWEDYAAGGPTGRSGVGEGGFSSPDNLVFDSEDNVWVVTDISSSSLNRPGALRVPRQQRGLHGPDQGRERRRRVPLRQRAGARGDHRAVLLAGRVDAVPQRPAPRRGDADQRGLRVRRPADVHLVVAGGQQDGEPDAVEPLPSLVAVTRVKQDAPDPGSPTIPPPAPGPGPAAEVPAPTARGRASSCSRRGGSR